MELFFITTLRALLILWCISKSLAECNEDDIELEFIGDDCSYEALLLAFEANGCSENELFGFLGVSNSSAASVIVTNLCPETSQINYPSFIKFGDIAHSGYQFDREFMNGGTYWNNGFNPDINRIQWVEDNVLHKRGIDFPEYLNNFKNCYSQASMCCWVSDSTDAGGGTCTDGTGCQDAEPDDNTDICYVDIKNSPYASHTRSGIAVYSDDKEGNANCMGFTWTKEGNDPSNKYKGNLLFEVAMRYGVKENGYTRNVPHAPMCGCVEQMPVVSNADCRDIESATNSWNFSSNKISGSKSISFSGKHITFNDCDGKDLATHYKTVHSRNIVNPIEGGCTEAEASFMFKRGYAKQDIPVKWVQVAGKGAYSNPTLSEQIFDGNTRYSSMTRNEFEELWANSNKILLRRCKNCNPMHRYIYYKRYDADGIPSNVNILHDVKENWLEYENNTWKEDFELYSSYSNAIQDKDPWEKVDHPYPVSMGGCCAHSGAYEYKHNQWNTWDKPVEGDRIGQRNIGFFVAMDPPIPTLTPTKEPTTLTTAPSSATTTTSNCEICDDIESNHMVNKGKHCNSYDKLDIFCNKKQFWVTNKICRLSCFNAGYGYIGDQCCDSSNLE